MPFFKMIFTPAVIVTFCCFICVSESLDGPCPNISYTPLPNSTTLAGEWTLAAMSAYLEPGKPVKCFHNFFLYAGQGNYITNSYGIYESGGRFNIPSELRAVNGQNYNYEFGSKVYFFLVYLVELSTNHYICAHYKYDASNNKCPTYLIFATRNGAILTDEKYNSSKIKALEKGVPPEVVNAMFRLNEDKC